MSSRWIVIACALWTFGCEQAAPPMELDPMMAVLRPRSAPIEFVGLSVTRPVVTEADVLEVLGPLFGRDGAHHARYPLDRGLLLGSAPDPRTPEQVIVTLEMEPTDGTAARTILRVPVSRAYGSTFLETVRAALARTAEVTATDPGGMHPWHLEYHVVSVNGGYLMTQVAYDGTEARVVVQTENPRTSLERGEINQAAFTGTPHEMIGGTVGFTLSRDEFDFFSSRAYGVSNGAEQNFEDFRLQPHDWLRLTVTPQIDDGRVDVAFEVVTLDGARVPFARAPASYVAGEQFRQNVFRMVDNMNAREAESPGSSTPFTVPFHYDDPAGGGVVRVIAEGRDGVFGIAYSVESPIHELRDTEFVPYVGDPLAEAPPVTRPGPRCEDHGSVEATEGRFELRFDASRTVRGSAMLVDELVGDVYGSVFRAEDVTISGPRDGAESVAQFHFEAVDIREGLSAESYLIDAVLPAGEYQILGFMDIDGNGAETGDPDPGDPVGIPIGGFDLACEAQHAVMEFALLLPEGL